MLLIVVFAARRVSTLTLLILGVLVGYAASALVSILLRVAAPENVQSYVIWTLGEFAGVSWGEAAILAPALVVGLLMAAIAVKPLNALLLGETYARSMGVAVERNRIWLIACTAVLAGAVTAFCGPIGFLGIAVPHLARGLFHTSDHRRAGAGHRAPGRLAGVVRGPAHPASRRLAHRCRSTPSPRSSARRWWCG